MVALPTPARCLTLSSINADYRRYLTELQDGGAIVVLSDDHQVVLGVLTRDPAVFGDAQVAQQIQAGHLPPVGELLEPDTGQPAA